MEFDLDLFGLMGLAAAFPLALLGLLALALNAKRRLNLAFAAFTITWASQIVVANLGRLASDPWTQVVLFRAQIPLFLATAFFLFAFASLHPRGNRLFERPSAIALVSLVPLALLGVLFVTPDAFVSLAPDGNGGQRLAFGLLGDLLVVPVFLAAFVYAVLTQLDVSRTAPTPTLRARARIVLSALALFLGYYTTRNLYYHLPPTDGATFPPSSLGPPIILGCVTLFLLVLAVLLRLPPLRRETDPLVSLVLVLPVAVATGEWQLLHVGVSVETGWFWRLAAVALLAYAIARYQLFDLDTRFRAVVLYVLPVGVAGFTVAFLVALFDSPPQPATLAVGLVLAVAGNVLAWLYRERLAQRFLLVGDGGTAYVDHRRLEVYRAALEERHDRQKGGFQNESGLKRLRARLRIDDRTHEVLAYAVSRALAREAPVTGAREESGSLVLERYRVDRLIGEGAHGRTLLAVDIESGDQVAIKTVGLAPLRGQAAELLMREARMLSRLRHENVVRMIDAQRDEQQAVLVMEYVDGGNLAGLLARHRRLPPERAFVLFEQVLAGLEAAHKKGIVHRDLKPENVLVTKGGVVKLADFGIAREGGDEATAVSGLAAAGTLPWMSPEQVRGVEVDVRSDLYSAGALLYRMLTGQHYLGLAGQDDFQVRRSILQRPARLEAGGLDPQVQALLARALAKDPGDRHEDTAAMRAELRACRETARVGPGSAVGATTA